MATEHRFGCPECGREDRIVELNEVLVDYPVTNWDEHGEPDSYGVADVCWDSVQRVESDGESFFAYRCKACDHEFDEPERLDPEGGEPDDA